MWSCIFLDLKKDNCLFIIASKITIGSAHIKNSFHATVFQDVWLWVQAQSGHFCLKLHLTQFSKSIVFSSLRKTVCQVSQLSSHWRLLLPCFFVPFLYPEGEACLSKLPPKQSASLMAVCQAYCKAKISMHFSLNRVSITLAFQSGHVIKDPQNITAKVIPNTFNKQNCCHYFL